LIGQPKLQHPCQVWALRIASVTNAAAISSRALLGSRLFRLRCLRNTKLPFKKTCPRYLVVGISFFVFVDDEFENLPTLRVQLFQCRAVTFAPRATPK
jgi:hypothetical protein